MKYYSTNGKAPLVTLEDAVIQGLADDRGLYMPERVPHIDSDIIKTLKDRTFIENSTIVAQAFFGDDMDADALAEIVSDTLSFETPVIQVDSDIYSLELFHGPTLAFKDVGARFMARMLGYFVRRKGLADEVNVLVATSGDTGGAVANGFLGVEGVRVFVLYPKGKVSPLQESQFTTLGRNITAIEIDGRFDDCQALVKEAFADRELNSRMQLTSANSINVARFLPQSFYYFNAYAQLDRMGKANDVIISVPSGNFGNLTAGLFAARMGLPVSRFIAANNSNDVFFNYLQTGQYIPRPSIETLANAMDVGNPSNFARILELYRNDYQAIRQMISGFRYDDGQIAAAIRRVLSDTGYLLDPHGTCGYLALEDYGLKQGQTGLFLETAHPAKFKETVEAIIGSEIDVPNSLKAFMNAEKHSVALGSDYAGFRAYLADNQAPPPYTANRPS